MRISDWSSDVCSSDLNEKGAALSGGPFPVRDPAVRRRISRAGRAWPWPPWPLRRPCPFPAFSPGSAPGPDRKSVVSGKSVSVRVDLGGRRLIKKKKKRDDILRNHLYTFLL